MQSKKLNASLDFSQSAQSGANANGKSVIMRRGPVVSDFASFSSTPCLSYLVNFLLQHLSGHLQVLQSHPQVLVLLLQTAPLLLHTVQLAVKADGYVLRHLRITRG